jgi:hypothetical protein
MMTVGDFWSHVAQYRRQVGGSVTSGGRGIQRNAAVGGKPNSPHLLDLGADVVHDGGTSDAARELIARGLGLTLVIEGDHDHLQPVDWNLRVRSTTARA